MTSACQPIRCVLSNTVFSREPPILPHFELFGSNFTSSSLEILAERDEGWESWISGKLTLSGRGIRVSVSRDVSSQPSLAVSRCVFPSRNSLHRISNLCTGPSFALICISVCPPCGCRRRNINSDGLILSWHPLFEQAEPNVQPGLDWMAGPRRTRR